MNIVTLPKKGLKTRPYNIGMEKRDLKKYDYTMHMDMEKEDLKKLSKGQLIRLLLKQEKKKPKVVIVNDTKPTRPNRPPPPIPEGVKPFRPTQTVKLRRKQKVVDDRPGWVRNPNTNRWIKIDGPTYRKVFPHQYVLNKLDRTHQEINKQSYDVESRYQNMMSNQFDYPMIKVELLNKALKGFTKSYEITIKNNKDPLAQLKNTRGVLAYHIKKMIKSMKGLKYVETLKITFEKISGKEIIYKTAYFNTPAETIINNLEITESLKMSMETIINKISSWISEGSGWTIQSVDNHYLNIVKYQPIRGSSYIQLPEELRNSAKGLINLKNKDDECLRWCHIRHLNPQEKDPQRIKKSDKEYVEKLN